MNFLKKVSLTLFFIVAFLLVSNYGYAKLKPAYVAVNGVVETKAEVVYISAYHFSLKHLKTLLDLHIETEEAGEDFSGPRFYFESLLDAELSELVEPGYIPVHNCTTYKDRFTICEVDR